MYPKLLRTYIRIYTDDEDETSKLLGQINEHIRDLSINDVDMVTRKPESL